MADVKSQVSLALNEPRQYPNNDKKIESNEGQQWIKQLRKRGQKTSSQPGLAEAHGNHAAGRGDTLLSMSEFESVRQRKTRGPMM